MESNIYTMKNGQVQLFHSELEDIVNQKICHDISVESFASKEQFNSIKSDEN